MGISDTLTPGSISQLLQSNELAFRVEFLDPPPASSNMYWRGPVLWHTDGTQWSRKWTHERPKQALAINEKGQGIRQVITTEATRQKWLFGLEMIVETNRGRINDDLQIITPAKINDRLHYEVRSYPLYQINEGSDSNLRRGLQLQPGYHPRTRQLATAWREQGMNDKQIIAAALQWFGEDEFYYTLQPPLLVNDNIDDFLFESKRGFCEHYASSFVVLMRAAGIPARIVTGYQGATYNPVGDYYNVYQRDAHAWAEVYLEDNGWTRIDPTAAVAPERIERGIEDAIPEVVSNPLFSSNITIGGSLLRNLRDSWDTINYKWNLWVLGYDKQQQLKLLEKFGLGRYGWQALAIALCLGVAGLMILFAWFIAGAKTEKRDPARILYDRFCHKLLKLGYRRKPYEGPMDFYHRITMSNAELGKQTRDIIFCYIDIRYGSMETDMDKFARLVKQFKPAAAAINT